MYFISLSSSDVSSEVLLRKVNSRLGIVVHLYLHSLERILVLAASSVDKRERTVSNMGSGSVLILSKAICSAYSGFIFSCSFCWINT
ncbi:hypothetical protein Hanom_Chr12g01172071 [Helianthus anomalus]